MAPLRFSDGQVETLKWIALGSMFVDHVGRLLIGYGTNTWVFAVGRVAFPLFALVLGLNLAREGDREARARRTSVRLGLWCIVAVPPTIWARGQPWMVNVLGTLALGCAMCWPLAASRKPMALRVGVVFLAAVGSHWMEFATPGVLLVVAVYLYATRPGPDTALLAALTLLLTAWLNMQLDGVGGFVGTLSAWLIAGLVRELPVSMPRLKLAFYLVYPLHLAVIGWLKS